MEIHEQFIRGARGHLSCHFIQIQVLKINFMKRQNIIKNSTLSRVYIDVIESKMSGS